MNQFYKRFNIVEEHIWNSPVTVTECVKASLMSVSGSWSSPSCHMTSARLSLTLLLSLVLALKAAELKRCCGDKQAERREQYSCCYNLWECSSVPIKNSKVTFTFSNLEILLTLTAVSRMIGGPRPKISLSRELNCKTPQTLLIN